MSQLTPQQIAVITHPVWLRQEFVSKDDILSRHPSDHLPKTPAAAQRVLCHLNGGVSATGNQLTSWCPNAPTTRFAYRLNASGHDWLLNHQHRTRVLSLSRQGLRLISQSC